MNENQINEKLIDLKKEMLKINGQIATKTTPENPGRVREVKKTIARLYTLIHQKKLQNNINENKASTEKREVKREIKQDSKVVELKSGGKKKSI